MSATGRGRAREPDWTLHLGDCADGLRTLPDGVVDALVTDPPAGIGFMSKEWDSNKGGRVSWIEWLEGIMKESLRAMKPGAHGLVWALPRTSHWTATALEQAGFEVRDVITHHFGTGFPKSLNISKAIDNAAGAEREVVGSKLGRPGYSLAHQGAGGAAWRADGSLDNSDGECAITAPATDAAKQWHGWGTALKPATEHWILVRKPLAGTVVANVLEHGTGGLNVDECRIAGRPDSPGTTPPTLASGGGVAYGKRVRSEYVVPEGRWPANLVLSHTEWCEPLDAQGNVIPEADTALEIAGTRIATSWRCLPGCPVALLDAQSGTLKSGTGAVKRASAKGSRGVDYGAESRPEGTPMVCYGDAGGASRFFYTSKPTTEEREADLALMPLRAAAELTGSKEGAARLDSPRTGAGRNSKGRANIHPTVKSVALMTWMIRLVTPPGGLVLDPFTGSGSTGVAALRAGFRFIGWERDPDYHRVAVARIDAAKDGPLFARAAGVAR